MVNLAVVDLEAETDKVGEDGGGSSLGGDRGGLLSGRDSLDGEPVVIGWSVLEVRDERHCA